MRPDIVPGASMNIADLYAEWSQVREKTFPDDERTRANYAVYCQLQEQILSIEPKTARDFAVQLVVETDHGESDYRPGFFIDRVLAIANAPSAKTPDYDPRNITAAGDELNRGIAIINTVWLALGAAEIDEDYERLRDTLYEGQRKLLAAERLIGLYQDQSDAK